MSTRTIDASSAGPAPPQPADATAALAAALLRFEAEFSAERPQRIVVSDASEAALAAALVAAKLLIPISATVDASAPAGSNEELIAQLADAYTPSA